MPLSSGCQKWRLSQFMKWPVRKFTQLTPWFMSHQWAAKIGQNTYRLSLLSKFMNHQLQFTNWNQTIYESQECYWLAIKLKSILNQYLIHLVKVARLFIAFQEVLEIWSGSQDSQSLTQQFQANLTPNWRYQVVRRIMILTNSLNLTKFCICGRTDKRCY